MEKNVYDLLLQMQSSMEEMNQRLKGLEGTVAGEMNQRLKGLEDTVAGEMNDRLKRVEDTVNKIEASQTEDVVGLLKVNKKKTDFEFDYLDNKITEMDKRLFSLEKRVDN